MTSKKSILLDPVLQGGLESDIVIPIMGQTKAGKSSFVNALLGWDKMAVGESMDSCTKFIQPAVIHTLPKENEALSKALGDRRIVFLDTPGFDDTDLGDDVVLVRIVQWLEATYRRGMLVGGVLYLHDINRDGWTGTSKKNLGLFHKLCGDDALNQVSFVTTKWEDFTPVKLEKALRRAAELRDNQWSELITGGACVYHLRPALPDLPGSPIQDVRDPWDVIHAIVVSMNARDVRQRMLLIQHELVNKDLFFIETKAGQALRITLQDLLNRAKEVQRQAVGRDQATLEEWQAEIDDLTSRLAKLNPALRKRVNRWLRKALGMSKERN